MIKLYDSAFSPSARKVRTVLEFKELEFQAIDGLLKANHEELKAVNGRIEVPVLVDDGIVVVNSAAIVAYLKSNQARVSCCACCSRPQPRLGKVQQTPSLIPFWSTSRIGSGPIGTIACPMAYLSGSC